MFVLSNFEVKPEKGLKDKSKLLEERKDEKVSVDGSKSLKCGVAPTMAKSSKQKKVTDVDIAPRINGARPQPDQVAESKARSSKLASKGLMCFKPINPT